MKINTNILIDALAPFNPSFQQDSVVNREFEKLSLLTKGDSLNNDAHMFIGYESQVSAMGASLPKNLILIGSEQFEVIEKDIELLIKIQDTYDLMDVYQTLNTYMFEFERWQNAVMQSILKKENLVKFLSVAAEKLTNPVALFDNRLALIAKAGNFEGSIEGTIWERVIMDKYASIDFYPPNEQQEISRKTFDAHKPMIFHTVKDKTHTYVTSQLKMGNKALGALGLVDINKEITDGQLDIIQYVNKYLKLYFRNNEEAALVFENETTFFTKLLDGHEATPDLVKFHFSKLNWSKTDTFQLASICSDVPFDIPLRVLPYIKHIRKLFKRAAVIHYKKYHCCLISIKRL